MKRLQVAVAVLVNANGEVLVSKRQEGQHLAGFWEFPGGKIEAGESIRQALQREVAEELGILIDSCSELIVIKHDYPEKAVELCVQLVEVFTGIARGLEGQQIAWVDIAELCSLRFPEANKKIIDALQRRHSYSP